MSLKTWIHIVVVLLGVASWFSTGPLFDWMNAHQGQAAGNTNQPVPFYIGWIVNLLAWLLLAVLDLLVMIRLDTPHVDKLKELYYQLHTLVADDVKPGVERSVTLADGHKEALGEHGKVLSAVHATVINDVPKATDVRAIQTTVEGRLGAGLADVLTQINVLSETVELLNRMVRVESLRYVPGVLRRKRRLLEDIVELSEGAYFIWTKTMIYHEDRELVKELNQGDSLRSTVCLETDPENQFKDDAHRAFVEEQIKVALERGVEVDRLYIVPSKVQLDLPGVQAHLKYLAGQKPITGRPIKVYYVLLDSDEMDARTRDRFKSCDLVLITYDKGHRRISRGVLDGRSQIEKALYTNEEKLVQEAELDWGDLMKYAREFKVQEARTDPAV